ncbi:MAG: nicotinamide mononucleotide transporter [Saprospiraceae bacterium]|nr:nicotinamide mononucleotide transporter [Saprospiraceae bacterium]
MNLWQALLDGLLNTSWLEFTAVTFGIISVLFSRMENIWVYPTGIVNTSIFIYLSVVAGLYAEAGVNVYYTVMSIIGWVLWSKKSDGSPGLQITRSGSDEWRKTLVFFALCWGVLYGILTKFTDSTVPLADAFASASAYTAMWLMARKKLENWLWWIATNIASIPLYFVKGLVFTSFQYLVFLMLAFLGYLEWRKRLNANNLSPNS